MMRQFALMVALHWHCMAMPPAFATAAGAAGVRRRRRRRHHRSRLKRRCR